jgi:hypothetical protein
MPNSLVKGISFHCFSFIYPSRTPNKIFHTYFEKQFKKKTIKIPLNIQEEQVLCFVDRKEGKNGTYLRLIGQRKGIHSSLSKRQKRFATKQQRRRLTVKRSFLIFSILLAQDYFLLLFF